MKDDPVKQSAGVTTRPIQYLTYLLVAIMIVLMGITLSPIFQSPPQQKYLQFNDTRGMEIEANGVPYTLNFEQQNEMIEIVNQARPISKEVPRNLKTPSFSNIKIYQFDKSDIDLTPLGYDESQLVFTVPGWNQNKPMIEPSKGKLKRILEESTH